MTSKRKEVVLQEEYLIIDGNNSLPTVVNDVNNSPSTVVNGVNNTQREKESKVNKSKVNKKKQKVASIRRYLKRRLKKHSLKSR